LASATVQFGAPVMAFSSLMVIMVIIVINGWPRKHVLWHSEPTCQ
jgi:hypothetical protein